MSDKYPDIPSPFTKDEVINSGKRHIIIVSPAMADVLEKAIEDELKDRMNDPDFPHIKNFVKDM